MIARRRSFAIGSAILVACAMAVPALAGKGGGPHTDAQNRRTAIRDAEMLLTRVRLPGGAVPSSREPGGDGGVLKGPAFIQGIGKLVDRHTWWTVEKPPAQVLHYIESNPPDAGVENTTCGGGGGNQPSWTCVGFGFPTRARVLGVRELAVKVVGLRDGGSGIRADAEVQWIIVRPASERVPPGVGQIVVSRDGPRAGEAVAVGDPSTIHKIIRLFDALPVLQPGSWSCPAIRSNTVMDRFSFQPAGGGSALARAAVRANVGRSQTGCDAMTFSIGGRPQMALVDARRFLLAVGHLLRFRLTEPPN